MSIETYFEYLQTNKIEAIRYMRTFGFSFKLAKAFADKAVDMTLVELISLWEHAEIRIRILNKDETFIFYVTFRAYIYLMLNGENKVFPTRSGLITLDMPFYMEIEEDEIFYAAI